MKALRAYTINFASLADGTHNFDYQIDNKFLENFEDALVKSANISAELQMVKMVHCLELHFKINGTVQTACDNCAEDFDLDIDGAEMIIVKIVEEIPTENDELNVVYIKSGMHSINVATMLYELIMLSIPMRRVHPLDENGNPTCNPKALKYLKNSEDISADEEAEDSDTNPIWDELKKLKK